VDAHDCVSLNVLAGKADGLHRIVENGLEVLALRDRAAQLARRKRDNEQVGAPGVPELLDRLHTLAAIKVNMHMVISDGKHYLILTLVSSPAEPI